MMSSQKTSPSSTAAKRTGTDEKNNVDATSPQAPAFCARMTQSQARLASAALTQRELQKLRIVDTAKPASGVQVVRRFQNGSDSISNDVASLHDMLLKYAEKYSKCCDQLCRMSAQMQETHSDMLKLKDAQHEIQTEKEHHQGMVEQYEEDVKMLQVSTQRMQTQLAQHRKREAHQSSCSVAHVLLFLVWTLFMLEMERLYQFNTVYSIYRV